MGKEITLAQVLQEDRPAFTPDLLYRFMPRRGFERASFVRFSPGWLSCPIPDEDRWIHEETCDCGACRAVVTAAPAESPIGSPVTA
jgi:hypothetical protein